MKAVGMILSTKQTFFGDIMPIIATHFYAYSSWLSMIHRCHNEKRNSFKRYGGIGITVCDRWRHSFHNFIEDMGERPKKTSLDRIDNKKGYFKENCRWASAQQQGTNKKSTHFIEAFGETLSLSEWSRKTGIKIGTIWKRLHEGKIPEVALQIDDLNGRYVFAFGERKTISDWSKTSNINATRICRRLNAGWTPEEAVSVEIKKWQRIKKIRKPSQKLIF